MSWRLFAGLDQFLLQVRQGRSQRLVLLLHREHPLLGLGQRGSGLLELPDLNSQSLHLRGGRLQLAPEAGVVHGQEAGTLLKLGFDGGRPAADQVQVGGGGTPLGAGHLGEGGSGGLAAVPSAIASVVCNNNNRLTN